MVHIPRGALVAGTPPNMWPRVADEEIPGEQVILREFYIDRYPFPNEEGAIPVTNLTQSEASQHCTGQGKRLCTELEWERACKGPSNLPYEYGRTYDPRRCDTGAPPRLVPSGIAVACQSEWGVRDLHGGVWEWTASAWGREQPGKLVTLRGGNSMAGELVGRCANGMGRAPDVRSPNIGFRCCAGEPNTADVVLPVTHGKKLEFRSRPAAELVGKVRERIPDEMRQDVLEPEAFVFDRSWVWRPVGNEELTVFGGCAGFGVRPACGVLVVRAEYGNPTLLGWASSNVFVPTVKIDMDPKDLWLFGGDDRGNFRRLIAYTHGRITVGTKERRIPKPDKNRSEKRRAKQRK